MQRSPRVHSLIVKISFAALLAMSPSSVIGQATPGVTSKELLIGSCSALEGPFHSLGTQQIKGAQAYFNLINDEGAVSGRKLKRLAYDDSYDPPKSEACFKRLQSQKVFALAFFVGTRLA